MAPPRFQGPHATSHEPDTSVRVGHHGGAGVRVQFAAMAFCAACQQPIVGQHSFALEGCEVIHRACARVAHTTVGQQLQQVAAAANERAARAERLLSESRAQYVREDTRERTAIDRAHAREVRELRREIENLHNDVSAARRESALHQTLARSVAVTAPPPVAQAVEPAAPNDDRTEAEIRFSLLELDPL